VKILDLGLARAYTGDPQDADDLANSTTISVAMPQADWLARLLRRCLDRDPLTRLQSIGEARIAIACGDDGSSSTGPAAGPARASARWPWLAATAALLGLAAVVVWAGTRPAVDMPLVRSELVPPEERFFAGASPFAVSPDDRQVAFVATSNQAATLARSASHTLWVRNLAEAEAREIPGTEGFIFQRGWSEGLMKIPAGGGTPEPLTTLDTDRLDIAHRWPHFLPDGRRLVLQGESRAIYSQGHLLYRVDLTLMAQRIEEESLELQGDAVPIATDVPGGGVSWGGAHFGASPGGVIVHLRGEGATFTQLVWRDREGNVLGYVGDEENHGEISPSHDGQRLAGVYGGSQQEDIWLYDLERGVKTRFTFDPADDRGPIWSPDDTRIAFVSARNAVGEIYVRPVSGNQPPHCSTRRGRIPS